MSTIDKAISSPTTPKSTSPDDTPQAAINQLTERKTFQRGVVVEVLNNLSLRDDDQLKKLESPVSAEDGLPKDLAGDKKENIPDILNPLSLEVAPRDSVIVRLVGPPNIESPGAPGAAGRDSVQTIVCYPFFSSHMCLPAKPGEIVWAFDPGAGGPAGGCDAGRARGADGLGHQAGSPGAR